MSNGMENKGERVPSHGAYVCMYFGQIDRYVHAKMSLWVPGRLPLKYRRCFVFYLTQHTFAKEGSMLCHIRFVKVNGLTLCSALCALCALLFAKRVMCALKRTKRTKRTNRTKKGGKASLYLWALLHFFLSFFSSFPSSNHNYLSSLPLSTLYTSTSILISRQGNKQGVTIHSNSQGQATINSANQPTDIQHHGLHQKGCHRLHSHPRVP